MNNHITQSRHYIGDISIPRLFTNHTSTVSANTTAEGTLDAGVYPIRTRGTHNAEIIDITDKLTEYQPDSLDGLQMRQAALDAYDDS